MARIRTTKPEFWTSEQVAECSPSARLLFIGMWSFCDDNGIHPASIKRLKMEVFPSDPFADPEIQTMVDELISADLLEQYTVTGKDYWLVTGWHKHQKIDRPTYRHPLPDGVTTPLESTKPQRELDEGSAGAHPRNGMESNGKNMSGNPDVAQILSYLNEKAARSYQPVPANMKLISARLKEGASPDQCKAVIDAKASAWLGDSKMAGYLRPKTLFNATNFAQYVGELGSGSPASGGQSWE
jgi:uncharacterized phage protein (TIGR02220 family)